MHKITISEGENDPVYVGTVHSGKLSQVEVRREVDEIMVDIQAAAGVDYIITVNGHPCTRGTG